jgi:hypothetical protein
MQTTLANIDSVMVAGRWKKRHGKLLDVDLAPKLAALGASGRKITKALGLSRSSEKSCPRLKAEGSSG